jgi:hypothetical protein
MARTHSSIATDSEEALRSVVGPDATADFEADPKFDDTDPAATASSSNVAVQRDTDDVEDSEEEEIEADEDDEDDELEDNDDEDEEEDEEDNEEDEDDDDEDASVEEESEAVLQAKTFDDAGEEDDDAGDVEPGLDDEDEDEDLDTDQVTDAALGLHSDLEPLVRLAATIRMAPATSVRAAASI